ADLHALPVLVALQVAQEAAAAGTVPAAAVRQDVERNGVVALIGEQRGRDARAAEPGVVVEQQREGRVDAVDGELHRRRLALAPGEPVAAAAALLGDLSGAVV